MIYTFKRNGARIAVHTHTGYAHLLDGLTFDMMEQVTPPLSEELPMGMRYFFAKYDSGDLKQAYHGIREIYALEEQTVSRDLTGACCTPEALGGRYASLLQEYAAGRTMGNGFDLLLQIDNPDSVQDAVDAARKALPDAGITLRCPLTACHSCEGVDAYQAVAGDISAFMGADLPENTVVVVSFSRTTDLSAEVTRLLDAGYAVCAVPEDSMRDEDAVKAYDALSRTLTRRRRTDREFIFLPFRLTGIPGIWMENDTPAAADLTTLPGAFWQYGSQKYLAGLIRSSAVLRCLAECALVLELS